MSKNPLEIPLEQFSKNVAKRLLELFNKSEFKTQDQIYKFLEGKVSTATLSELFSGNHNITAYKLALIIDALGGSADYVFFGKEKRPLLSDFRNILEQVEKESSAINDRDIREIVLALTEKKKSNMGLFQSIRKLSKLDKDIDKNKINALNVIVDAILAE